MKAGRGASVDHEVVVHEGGGGWPRGGGILPVSIHGVAGLVCWGRKDAGLLAWLSDMHRLFATIGTSSRQSLDPSTSSFLVGVPSLSRRS